MKTPKIVSVVFALLVLLSGCTREMDDAAKLRIAALETKISEIEKADQKRNDFLLSQISEADDRFANLQKEIDDLRLRKTDKNESAVLLADSNGFSIIRNECGAFAIKVTKVQPYIDGQEVTFLLNNLTSAILDRPKLKVNYGERPPDEPRRDKDMSETAWRTAMEAYVAESQRVFAGRRSAKETDFNCPQGGTSVQVKVILAPATPREAVWFLVELDCDRLRF